MFKSMLAFVTVLLAVTASGCTGDEEICRNAAMQYGWELSEKCTAHEPVTIPDPLDEIYKSYNDLQKSAGMDLEPYVGMTGERYTFEVYNYPFDVGEAVYANIICINKKAVAGDIMTVGINGFMHSMAEVTP